MTNYLLPETDRIATDVNPLLADIAANDEGIRNAVASGAITVIGLLKESVEDLLTQVKAEAVSQGVTEEEAEQSFGVVFDGLSDILQPRLDALRNATEGGKTEDDRLNDLVEGLFAQMFGPELAAQTRAAVEAQGAEAAEAEEEEESDIDEEFIDEEFNKFMQSLFGSAV